MRGALLDGGGIATQGGTFVVDDVGGPQSGHLDYLVVSNRSHFLLFLVENCLFNAGVPVNELKLVRQPGPSLHTAVSRRHGLTEHHQPVSLRFLGQSQT